MPIDKDDFTYIQQLLKSTSAMVLDHSKEYFVETRLLGLMRVEGAASMGEVIARIRQGDLDLRRKFVEYMTINETSFFRDLHPFETLRKEVIPRLIAARAPLRRLDIWCGASSSGQEPYSIAMILDEQFPSLRTWNVRILATDLSNQVLEKARSGIYSQLEVNRGLPPHLLARYFKREGLHDWRISEDLRRMIDFRPLNLARELATITPQDVVFMRNVMIYFDAETRNGMVRHIRRILRPDGYFFVGASENLMHLNEGFDRQFIDKTTCYRPLRAAA